MTVSVSQLQPCPIRPYLTDTTEAFKPNSTNMVVQNMWCNGSHGISVGSLGQVGTVSRVYHLSRAASE